MDVSYIDKRMRELQDRKMAQLQKILYCNGEPNGHRFDYDAVCERCGNCAAQIVGDANVLLNNIEV